MGVNALTRSASRASNAPGRLVGRSRFRRCLALSAASVAVVLGTVLTPGLSSAVSSLGGWGSTGSGNGQFNSPKGVASFGSGARVYVTDMGNNRIEEFNDRGNFFRNIGPISEPWAIAVVPKINGDIYVASNRSGDISQYTADGGFIRKWRPYSQAGGASTPSGLAVSPVNGDVYLASVGKLEQFTAQGTFLRNFPLAVVNKTMSASGVAIAPNGDVYVSSYSNVQVYSSNGNLLRTWGINGTDPGQFRLAVGIAVSERGDVFVLDAGRYSGRVQHFTPDGRLLQTWADDVSLNGPSGIGMTGNGVVFVANTNRNRIESYRP
jgi:tripartite motif-containing protein 71